MKRIFIIINPDAGAEQIAELEQLKKKIGSRARIHRIKAVDPMEVLNEVYRVALATDESCSNSLVLYKDGTKTQSLNALPCARLDLSLLLTKIKEAVGSEEDVYNKNVICTLYAGAVCALVK